MKTTLSIGLAVVLAGSIMLRMNGAMADEHSSSGTSEKYHASDAYDKTVTQTPGNVMEVEDTTWQNDQSQGSRQVQKKWDKESGTGTYTATTTMADGKIISEEGTITKNADGSLTEEGTATDPQGKTTTVKRTIAKDEDDTGDVTETYSTDPGTSGRVITKTTTEENTVRTEHSVPDRAGKTWGWGQSHGIDAEGKPITRDIPLTNPKDESRSYNESVSIDEATNGE